MKVDKIIVISMIVLVSGCSPKYITKTTKIAPTTKEGKACLVECNQKYNIGKQKFVEKCKAKVESCFLQAEQRVTTNFSRYEEEYKKDLVQYKNNILLYEEKFEAYKDAKAEYREEYDSYYDKKQEYREKLDEYNSWKREKDENEENERICRNSSNKNSCQKVKEYKSKHMFESLFDRPKKPEYEPKKPQKKKIPIKPVKPIKPEKPILSKLIEKEKNKCADSCSYRVQP